MLNISLVIFFIAFAFLSMSGLLYRWRAFTNKKAWNGMVLPFATIGGVLLVISLVMLYFYYPR